MRNLKTLMAAALLGASLLFITGCASARLESGGAYAAVGTQPDMAFYQIDAAYAVAEGILDGVFKFEFENRNSLWAVSPDIKHGLDNIRPEAELWKGRYLDARTVYKAMPVPANLTPLQACLAKMQQLQASAQTLLPQGTPAP